MKGDFSRNTFAPKKHYSGVRWQQGRPVTDADENEAQDILNHRMETETGDTIGQSGAPKENPGFGLTAAVDDLGLSAGRFYVDGIACEVDGDLPTRYNTQPHLPNPPAISSLLEGADLGLVYLDVFKRHITFHDDDSIRDAALNGVDTTSRLQTVWQVKILPLDSVDISAADMSLVTGLVNQIADLNAQIAAASDPAVRAALIEQRDQRQRELVLLGESLNVRCDGSYPEWDQLLAPPGGTLQVTTAPTGTVSDPCDVPPGGGYTRGENQYYIIQVHSVPQDGSRSGATFKWSRDNGSIVARIQAFGSATSGTHTGATFDVNSVGRDDYLGIKNNDWVEYVDDNTELNGLPGVLAQVSNADSNLNRITLSSDLTVDLNAHPKLRKWDGVNLAMNTTDSPLDLEAGIQVQFGSGSYRPGDYWQFAARSVTGTIDYPDTPQPAFGIQHHFARLGIVTLSAGNVLPVLDCRPLFPALTAITAADVSFDNANCELGDARTVQEALDALCMRTAGGSCTLTASPGANWFTIFDQVPEGGDAEICLEVGDYPVAQPVLVSNKGHLLVHGAGKGTRLLAAGAESVLVFQDCASVTVRDLTAIAGAADSGENNPSTQTLNGALTFLDCGSVSVENVAAQCASAAELFAACLTIRNTAGREAQGISAGSVRIQHCDLRVGHQQAGILVVNGARVRIFDNMIRVGRRPQGMTLEVMLQNRQFRAAVRHLLVHHINLFAANAPRNRRTVLVRANNHAVSFDTPGNLVNAWQALMEGILPRGAQSGRELYLHLRNVADRLILNGGRYPGVAEAITQPFADWYAQLRQATRTIAGQGIVVGGTLGRDIQIQGNTVYGFQVGIKAALSHDAAPREPFDSLGSLSIANNEIELLFAPTARLRFGVFVGSCQRMEVDNNHVSIRRLGNSLPADGIRIWGELGEKMLVRGNSLVGASTGIHVHPLRNVEKQRLWLVAENVMPDAQLVLMGGILQRENIFG